MSAPRPGDLVRDPLAAGPREPICVIAHTYYDEDPRVRREAEALASRGYPVDVFALRRQGDEPFSVVAGVRVFRLPVRRHQGATLLTYAWEYTEFLARSSVASWRAQQGRRYALAHVHSMPDFLVFAALPLRVGGARILLDLHEAMPEFFRSRFPGAVNRLTMALVRLQEQASIAFAHRVITANHSFADRLAVLGTPAWKLGVVLNSPSLERFDPSRHRTRTFMEDGVLRLIYTGALTPTYELDVVLEAVARMRRRRPELALTLDLYGRGDSRASLEEQSVSLGLDDVVRFHERIPLEAVPAAIAGADLGIAPTRRDAFTDLTISTKNFEYAAMGKPVVASRLRTLEVYLAPDTVKTYESGDADGLAAAILQLVDTPGERDARVERTARQVRELAWEREAERFLALVERLIGTRHRSPGSAGRRATATVMEGAEEA